MAGPPLASVMHLCIQSAATGAALAASVITHTQRSWCVEHSQPIAMKETFELTLPTHWSAALINGDPVSPDCDEAAEAEEESFMRFCFNEIHGADCVGVEEESFFSKHHDAKAYGVLACDCSVFTFQGV